MRRSSFGIIIFGLTLFILLPKWVHAQELEENLFDDAREPTTRSEFTTCAVGKIDRKKSVMAVRCKTGTENLAVKQSTLLTWEGKRGTVSRPVKVAKVDPIKGIVFLRFSKKNPRMMPRKGWKVSLQYSVEEIASPSEERQQPREEKSEERQEEKRESRDSSDWEFFDRTPGYRLDIGYGTATEEFFKFHLLDLRLALSFFPFPVFLELGLQPSYSSITVAAVKFTLMGVHLTNSVRLDMNLGPYVTLAVSGGVDILGFGYRDNPTETVTSLFDKFSVGYAGQLTFNLSEVHHLYARFANKKAFGAGIKVGFLASLGYSYYF